MEHIVCSSLMNHAEYHNILYSLQQGLRPGRSCETQLLEMVNVLVNNVQLGLQTHICILDFSKAFDQVGHRHLVPVLVEKLRMYGINGEPNTWIENVTVIGRNLY